MRLHPITGQVAHGIAGEGVYIEGQQVAPGGGLNGMPDWVDGGLRWAGQDGEATSLVRCSQVGAWAKWSPEAGVERSDGFRLSKAVLLDMSPAGTMLVGDDYQRGVGISAYKVGSTVPAWRVPTARPEMRFPYSQAAILDAQTACWTENVNGRMVLVGYFSGALTIGPRPPWNVLHVRLFRVAGQPWVVYLRGEDDRIIAHPWDYRGMGFSVPGFGFGPDAHVQGSTLTLHWSVGAGELPADMRSKAFNLAALEEVPSVAVALPSPVVPSLAPVFAGAFFADDLTPGNVTTWGRGPIPTNKALIVSIDVCDQVPAEQLAGLWVAHERWTDANGQRQEVLLDERIAQSRPVAERLKVPMFVYDDQREYRTTEIDRWCDSTPWIAMPQWYIGPTDNPATFAADMAAQARALGVPYVPAIRITSPAGSGITETQVALALNALAGILEAGDCLGWILFAWNRADGVTGVPAFLPYGNAWLAGKGSLVASGARRWAAQWFSEAEPLSVTITDYTRAGTSPLTVIMQCETNARDGANITALVNGDLVALVMVDRGFAVLGFTLTEPGEYNLTARVTDGSRVAETGARRLIRVTPPIPEIPGITYPTQPGSGTVECARKAMQEAADAARKEEGK